MNSAERDDMLISEALQDVDVDNITWGHAYLPYSHYRVKEVFLENGIELRPYYNWYKAMRYRSCQSYVLVDMYTNETIGNETGYTLYSLCCFLAQNGVPLHSDKPKKYRPKTKRRESCEQFLQIVSNLENSNED